MKNFTSKIFTLAMAGGISLAAASALASPGDDFNRNSIGGNWVSNSGTLSVSGKELVGTTLAIGTFTPANAQRAASAVVFLGGTALQYGAIALGNIAGGSNAFVKIQEQNGSGMFEFGAFYTGNNGGGTFFALSSPVPSPAVLDVFFCGTTANMRITSAAGVQAYSLNYGTTFGPGAGAGTYGPIGLDNFVANNSACSGAPVARSAIDMPSAVDKSK